MKLVLRASRERLKAETLRVERAEALRWMAGAAAASFDLVLLDPPFDTSLGEAATQAAVRLVAAGGWVYLEGPQPLEAAPAGLLLHRSLRAGAVHAQLFRRTE